VNGAPAAAAIGAPLQDERRLLVVEDLKTYFRATRGLVRAVDGVSFSLAAGRTLGIVGESGSGKSVLARSLLGLVPEPPGVRAGGSILFGGRDLRRLAEREFRQVRGREIAMVFQDPMTALNPVMPIGRQIAQVLKLHLRMTGTAARARALELLTSVGIPSPRRRLGEYPHQLSGGMRQRVMIALALACDPRLLIADEPTTALDVTVQAQILDLLKRQQEDRHMALILISHDLGVVAGLADDIAVMYAGRIVERASAEALFADMRMPYTAALFRSIPKLANASHTRLEAIGGRPPDLVDLPAGCRFAPRCRFADEQCRAGEPALAGESAEHVYACWHPMHLHAGGGHGRQR
jgi:peptide/nickel transport system ATP-binding protein